MTTTLTKPKNQKIPAADAEKSAEPSPPTAAQGEQHDRETADVAAVTEPAPASLYGTGTDHQVVIDKEFRDLIPPLSKDEREQLEASLKKDGCRESLVVWEGEDILVDGHHRYEICEANGIKYRVVYRSFTDRTAAMDWMILNQLGRRNLDPKAASLLRGKLYNANKKTKSEAGASKGQNDPCSTTAAQIAKRTGVSEKTVKRDGDYASAAEELGDAFDKDAPKTDTIAKAKAKKTGKPIKVKAKKAGTRRLTPTEKRENEHWSKQAKRFRDLGPKDQKSVFEKFCRNLRDDVKPTVSRILKRHGVDIADAATATDSTSTSDGANVDEAVDAATGEAVTNPESEHTDEGAASPEAAPMPQDDAEDDEVVFESAGSWQLMASDWTDGIFSRELVKGLVEDAAQTHAKDRNRCAQSQWDIVALAASGNGLVRADANKAAITDLHAALYKLQQEIASLA